MKTKSKLTTAIIACLLLCTVIFCGACGQILQNKPNEVNPSIKGLQTGNVSIVEIDNCEYVVIYDFSGYGNYSTITHKGNCRFCAERSKK